MSSGTGGMTQYLYDADGTRVAKGTITSWSCDTTVNGFVATKAYVLGPGGEQLTEMSYNGGAWQWAHTNVWVAGQLVATYSPDPDTTQQSAGILNFYLNDWLGTRRVTTDYAGKHRGLLRHPALRQRRILRTNTNRTPLHRQRTRYRIRQRLLRGGYYAAQWAGS